MSELFRVLAVLVEPPGPEHAELARLVGLAPPTSADHTDLFVLQLYPYASVHLGPEGQLGGEARDRVAGFHRALGQVPPNEPDHLAVLLGGYASLLDREAEATATGPSVETEAATGAGSPWARARETLLVEHLLSWLPAYLGRVRDLGTPSYRGWAELLDELLHREADRTASAATLLPAHLQDAPGLLDPRDDDVGAFVEGLLAPLRLGMTLTASDLARMAEDLGLGRRVGERRFVLRSLLDQDAAAVLGWLAEAGRAVAAGWDAHWYGDSSTGRWWRDRALAGAGLLDELAADAAALDAASAAGAR